MSSFAEVVKQNIYKISPNLYGHLLRFYQISPYAKRRNAAIQLKNAETRRYWSEKLRIRVEYESIIIREYLNDDWTVRHGPFADMKYAPLSSNTPVMGKVIGFYESPIHQWVVDAIDRNYEVILNIGCAEGYYAVGFALKSKVSTIYAYDIDEVEQENAAKLAHLNGIANKIHLRGLCTIDELNQKASNHTLIFCDIEGSEFDLLRPDLAPGLSRADLIVEVHESYHPGLTETLVSRFLPTHRIELTYHCAKSPADFPVLQTIPGKEYALLLQEGREHNQCWMRLLSNPPGAIKPVETWWPTTS